MNAREAAVEHVLRVTTADTEIDTDTTGDETVHSPDTQMETLRRREQQLLQLFDSRLEEFLCMSPIQPKCLK